LCCSTPSCHSKYSTVVITGSFEKPFNVNTTLHLKNPRKTVCITNSTVLALATLGKATQIGITLFAQSNQGKYSTVAIAGSFEKTSRILYNFTLEKSRQISRCHCFLM
jgi:hypothetical protein